jgi:hypothetical protein
MTATYIDPLNLKYLFVNTFAGSSLVFGFIFFIGISILAGMFKMPNIIYLIMLALASIMLQGWIGGGFYLLAVLIASLVAFFAISKIVKN